MHARERNGATCPESYRRCDRISSTRSIVLTVGSCAFDENKHSSLFVHRSIARLTYVKICYRFAGLLSVWQLQAFMTKLRMFAGQIPSENTGETHLEIDKLTADRFTFMGSVKSSIAHSYYSIPDMPKLPSLRGSVCLGFIGTSSFATISTLNCADTGEVYVRNVDQVVSVDKSTRKPMPLPEWWRTKYAPMVVGNEPLALKRFSQPETVHRYECRVPWSDVDIYRHTNFSAYIRYCSDCATDGVYNGAYSSITDTLSNYLIKDTSISFYNESNANDTLQISSWEDKDKKYLLRFEGTNNGKTVFQSCMEFYPTEAAL